MMQMNQEHLEDWSRRVVQELQEICDEAQVAAGNPDGEDQLIGTRCLIKEFDHIAAGRDPWLSQLQTIPGESESTWLNEL